MPEQWSERAVTLLAHLSGAEGPLRRFFDFTRPHGLGERVVKSALAAVIAWIVASQLPDNNLPLLAPLTAMFSINLTISGGMQQARQRILGVIFGISAALVVNWLLGTTGLSIGIVILLSFLAGRRLRLDPSGVEQMAVTTLIVVITATAGNFEKVAALHFANTLIGTGVGLLLNITVAPPNYVPGARKEILALEQSISAILANLSIALSTGIERQQSTSILLEARQVASSLHEVENSISRAEVSLQFNIIGRRQRPELAAYRTAIQALERSAIQARIIARSLDDAVATAQPGQPRPAWLEPDRLGLPLSHLLKTTVEALDHFVSGIVLPSDQPSDTGAHRAASIDVNDAALETLPELMPGGWVLLGQVIAVAGQLVTDLAETSEVQPVAASASF